MVSEDVAARVLSYIRHQAAKPPEALAALVADSQRRLLDAFAACDGDAALRAPAPGEWSMRELARHVVSAEHGVGLTIERLSRGESAAAMARAGMSSNDGQASYGSLLERLRETNARLTTIIAALPAEANVTLTAAHPFFGELNCREWAAFQRVHDEDHIQHAAKIVAAVGA
ncbi:MAG: DinB family protein [Dehalococcoidia bacterium]|nr:DinB family protein [Dehalococcoidia bacterium]